MSHYRIGCCVPGASFMPEGVAGTKNDTLSELLAGAETVKRAGFDYAEVGVGMIMKLSADETTAAADALSEKYGGSFRVEACNSFIPPTLKIIGGELKKGSPLYDYVDGAMMRMRILGADTVVFGSGGARKIPDGMTKEEGLSHIADFLSMCGDLGEIYGVTVAVEPLRPSECNAVNLTGEGCALSLRVNHPKIKYLADAFHMFHGGEAPDALLSADILPVHIHISEPDRSYPGKTGSEYLIAFADALRKTSYAGRISVECKFDDFEREAFPAHDFTDKYF